LRLGRLVSSASWLQLTGSASPPYIDRLARDRLPEGCRKLKGPDGLFRIGVGSFRIVYRIQEDELVVLVLAIGNRREIYEEIARLLR
jgi:hypothetical protein